MSVCDHLAKLVLRREERAERGSEKERNRVEEEEEDGDKEMR